MKKPEKVQNHPDFARRLNEAYDALPDAPTKNHGQLGWIVDRVKEKTGKTITEETPRKWLAGQSRPRKHSMKALADILGVTGGWLDFGDEIHQVRSSARETKVSVPAKVGEVERAAEFVTISISRSDLERLNAIGNGLFTPGEIISRLLNNLGKP